jgi:dihydroneopterin aldolase
MTDKICIKNLTIDCEIGVYDEERGRTHPLCYDIELSTDLSASSKTDSLSDTVDYFELTTKIVTAVKKSHFQLIESLAEHVVDICLHESKISSVNITLKKPMALNCFGAEVSINVTRNKKV